MLKGREASPKRKNPLRERRKNLLIIL